MWSIVRISLAVRHQFAIRQVSASLLGFLTLALFPPSAALGQALEDDLQSCRAAWNEYLKQVASFRGTITRSTSATGPPGTEWQEKSQVKFRDHCALWTRTKTRDGAETIEAAVANKQYSFEATCKPGTQQWVLTKYSAQPSASSINPRETVWIHSNGGLTLIGFREWLPFLVADSDFRITGLKHETLEKGKFLRLQFAVAPRHKKLPQIEFEGQVLSSGSMRLQSGQITLDPENSFLIKSFDIVRTEGPHNVPVTATNDFHSFAPGMPMLARSILVSKDPESMQDVRHAVDYEYSSTLPDEREFTLTAFGLPEPALQTTSTTMWYLWLLGAGAMCLIVAGIVRRMRRPANA